MIKPVTSRSHSFPSRCWVCEQEWGMGGRRADSATSQCPGGVGVCRPAGPRKLPELRLREEGPRRCPAPHSSVGPALPSPPQIAAMPLGGLRKGPVAWTARLEPRHPPQSVPSHGRSWAPGRGRQPWGRGCVGAEAQAAVQPLRPGWRGQGGPRPAVGRVRGSPGSPRGPGPTLHPLAPSYPGGTQARPLPLFLISFLTFCIFLSLISCRVLHFPPPSSL